MKRLIFSALVLSAVTANAQVKNGMVGINTDEPRATMHIEPGVSESKGLIIPRITAAQMKTMTNLAHFGADHHAIITYLKETLPATDRTGKLAEVSEAGYYFYNHTAAKWQKFGGGAEQDFKAIPGSFPGQYNYLTKGAGVGGNGTSLGTGSFNIGIGQDTFKFANSSDMTGGSNVGVGQEVFRFLNGATMSANNNIGIGQDIYRLANGGFMAATGNNIGMGNAIYILSKTNAQFLGGGNTSIGGTIFNLTDGDLTGNGNIGVGSGLYTMQSGNLASDSNIALGSGMYVFNKTTGAVFTGSTNTGIGHNILNLQNGDLIGNNNIGIGGSHYTLTSGNMEGDNNIGIGQQSYYVNKGNITNTANSNIALGNSIYRLSNSSTSTFSGQNNIGIGNTLYNLTSGNLTGQNNIGMGTGVFNLYTGDFSGNDNIGIGNGAMYGHGGITGNYNIALGYNSIYTNGKIAGTDNIAIGNSVLQPSTGNDIGSYNIGIGNWALYGNMGNGNANIQIGNWYVGTPVAGKLNNVVAIGNEMNGLSPSNTDSNTILLGMTGSNGPKVGIGTYKPGAKLEINNGTTAGAVKIVDGTEGAGKVLTSDANGLATWKRQALTLIEGVKGSGISIPPSTGGYIYTGSYITLPPGKYMVSVQNLMTVGFPKYSDGHFWLRTTFSDSNTTFTVTTDIDSTKGFLISGLLPQGARFSMLNGSLIIENTTSSPKTYYYWAGDVEATPGTTIPLENFGSWAEWSMIATPIQ